MTTMSEIYARHERERRVADQTKFRIEFVQDTDRIGAVAPGVALPPGKEEGGFYVARRNLKPPEGFRTALKTVPVAVACFTSQRAAVAWVDAQLEQERAGT